jgi:hypothetical protein
MLEEQYESKKWLCKREILADASLFGHRLRGLARRGIAEMLIERGAKRSLILVDASR